VKGIVAVLGGVLLLFLAALVTVEPRAVVAWKDLRAVAVESDDWGLAGFIPRADSWQGLDRAALEPGRFPPVYWQSTLEDAAVIERLVQILASHPGRDGIGAVFQPNYVMGSLAWDRAVEQWVRYDLPHWPQEYARPGMWEAVTVARQRGVWHPELHAALHYDPALRQENALASELAREVTRRGISLFPGSEGARELAPWRPASVMTAELDSSLAIFARVFRRPVRSIIAPDYTWHGWIESLWQSRGLRVIQAKREQRNPQWLAGTPGRVQKYLDRQLSRWLHPGRVYLERNCRLEPVQAADPQEIIARCAADTRRAWRRGQPAIVETHRINYAHTDASVVETGLTALADYLDIICGAEPGPVFLCDSEIAQLTRRGTSWRVAGDQLVLRNGTHASRVIAVPAAALANGDIESRESFLVRLAANEVRRLALADLQ